VDRIVKERAFSDAGLALYYQRSTLAGSRPIEQPIEHRALVLPTT
jgi:hypothetical protein